MTMEISILAERGEGRFSFFPHASLSRPSLLFIYIQEKISSLSLTEIAFTM